MKALNKNHYIVQDILGFNIIQRSYNSILPTDKIKPWIKPGRIKSDVLN